MWLGLSRRNVVPEAQYPRRRPSKRRRLTFDTLEDRRLLSAGALTAAGPEFPVSAATGVWSSPVATPNPNPREVAIDNAGNAAAVWMSPDANGDGNITLNYQYYSNNSGTLTPTFAQALATAVVPSSAGNWIGFPTNVQVAMAPDTGESVALWQTSAETRHGTTTFTTHAQVFTPTGPVTAPFTVGGNAQAVSVAMGDNGFDVLYGAVSGVNLTATVQQYSSAGLKEGSAISIVPISYGTGSISMDNAGDFVVAWNASPGIDVERYNSSGQAQGSVIQVLPAGVNGGGSTVSMDPVSGDFVVAWHQGLPNPVHHGSIDDALFARQFSANGTPIVPNSAITVATQTMQTVSGQDGNTYAYPTGGMNGDNIGIAAVPGGNGAFDVTWTNHYMTLVPSTATPSGWQSVGHSDIYAKSYDSSGAQTQWLAMTSDDNSAASAAAVNSNGDLLALFNDAGQITGRLYQPNAQVAGGFVVSAPASATAGQPITVTVTATNSDGSTNTSYNGTLYLASSSATVGSDPSQQGLPASVTLTNGVGSFNVSLEAAGQQTLTASSADGSITASATVDVVPAAAAYLVVAPSTNGIQVGTPITITVTAVDAFGNTATGDNDTLVLTSSDSAAAMPNSVTLLGGVGTFTVTFNSTGTQTLTATDPTSSISGNSGPINVYPPPKHGRK